MSKRGCSSSSDRLTGGSGDVNPQQLILIGHDIIPSATTGTVQATVHAFPNPAWELNRSLNPGVPKTAFVLEVLKVSLLCDWLAVEASMGAAPQIERYISLVSSQNPIPALAAGSGYTATLEWLAQAVRGQPSFSSNTLAMQMSSIQAATTPTGSPVNSTMLWTEFDLTDGDGHGVVVGNPIFSLLTAARLDVVTGLSVDGESYYGLRMLYRYKSISYDEYVRQFAFGM